MTIGTLKYETYIDHIRREGDSLLAAIRRAEPTDVVRSYPGFRAAGLASHIGRVLYGADQCVRTGTFPWLGFDEAPSDTGELYDWAAGRLDSLVDAFQTTDPEKPIKHPFEIAPQVVGFLPRYLSAEISTHRWDAESVTGSQTPLPADLSDDAIDYTREVWVPGFGANVEADLDAVIGFRSTDTDGYWRFWSEDGRLKTARGQGPVGLEVSGAASDLFLLLWKRIEPTTMTLDFSGDADASVLGRFLSYDYVISSKVTPFH